MPSGTKPLAENAGLAFLGETAWPAAQLTGRQAKLLLAAPNRCGRPNADVLRRRLAVADGTPAESWQIDFPVHFTDQEAALYEKPFALLTGSWRNPHAQPDLRRALARLSRYPAMPADADTPDWLWSRTNSCLTRASWWWHATMISPTAFCRRPPSPPGIRRIAPCFRPIKSWSRFRFLAGRDSGRPAHPRAAGPAFGCHARCAQRQSGASRCPHRHRLRLAGRAGGERFRHPPACASPTPLNSMQPGSPVLARWAPVSTPAPNRRQGNRRPLKSGILADELPRRAIVARKLQAEQTRPHHFDRHGAAFQDAVVKLFLGHPAARHRLGVEGAQLIAPIM